MCFSRRTAAILVLLACFFTGPNPSARELRDASSMFADYGAEQQRAYSRTMADYHAAIVASPDDAALVVAQCNFIQNFTYSEEIAWTDSAQADLDACEALLAERFAKVPEVRVHQLEQTFDEKETIDLEALRTEAENWPKPLRARIAAKLYQIHSRLKRSRMADNFAIEAAELGDTHLVDEAISGLVRRGETQRAMVLAAAAEPPTQVWSIVQRIKAFAELPDKTVARHAIEQAGKALLDAPAATRLNLYLAADDLVAANRVVGELGNKTTDQATRADLFKLAMANRDPETAARHIRLVGDGFGVAVQRYAQVVAVSPLLAVKPALLMMTMGVLATLALLALLPGLLLVPVHYRGLMRRCAGRTPPPLFERIGLRHAWIACVVLLLVPLLVACVMYPDRVAELFADQSDLSVAARFDVVSWGTLAALSLLLPWLPRFSRLNLLGELKQVPRTLLLIALSWLIVMLLGWLSHLLQSQFGMSNTATAQTRTVEALVRHGTSEYGILPMLLMIAVVVPIFEELIFRGFLLGGLSRHISFGWANLLQSLLFAAIHDDPPRFVVYWSLGLLAGWLVRRNRVLWPAIVLHALNNALFWILWVHQ